MGLIIRRGRVGEGRQAAGQPDLLLGMVEQEAALLVRELGEASAERWQGEG